MRQRGSRHRKAWGILGDSNALAAMLWDDNRRSDCPEVLARMKLREYMARHRYGLLRYALLAALVAAGIWLRRIEPIAASASLTTWRPWARSTAVTLYFLRGQTLFPVSRRLPASADLPRVTLQSLIDGPSNVSGLANPIPPGVRIQSLRITGGVAHIDLSPEIHGESGMKVAEISIVETMTGLPGIDSVALSVDGQAAGEPAKRQPLLYYASSDGLVAIPVAAATPRAAVDAYLAGPADQQFTGLPRDVRLLHYEYDPAKRLASLNVSYTPSIRTLAIEKPERMRFALLGLIATLTEFPQVRAVQLDFEGRARLGLGQCSDLLRTPQPRPELLNDERLLGR